MRLLYLQVACFSLVSGDPLFAPSVSANVLVCVGVQAKQVFSVTCAGALRTFYANLRKWVYVFSPQ
jgi:hypothetical protein